MLRLVMSKEYTDLFAIFVCKNVKKISTSWILFCKQ